MKSLTIVILAGLSSLQLFSQSINTGTVTSNDFPIPGASVYIEGSYTGVSTNDKGEFSFKTAKTGNVTLKVESIGFEPFTKELEITKLPIQLDIKLKEAFTQLDAITITAPNNDTYS